jgi:predicted Zn-dependent protease
MMNARFETAGVRYDGTHPAGEPVYVTQVATGWQVTRNDGAIEHFDASQVVADDDTDPMQRTLRLPNQSMVVLDQGIERSGVQPLPARYVDRWLGIRQSGAWSALAVVVIPVVLLFVVLPAIVSLLAASLPISFEKKLGEIVLESTLQKRFRKSALDEARQRAIEARFEALRSAAKLEHARLVFFRGTINAFALPGGVVAMSDELVNLLDNDDHIAAVLAHELGHVHHRHILRNISTQLIASKLLTVAMANDQLTGKVVNLVTERVLSAQYSQAAEREADRYACELLASVKQSPAALAEGFKQFAAIATRYNVDVDSGTYTSTHPPADTRIEAAKNCAAEFGFAR